MKVLLINPTTTLIQKSRKLKSFFAPILPTGMGIIAAVLEREGIDVKVIDQFANKITNNRLLNEIKKYCPDIIGFSCITPVMSNVKILVNEIRNFTNALIVFGNIHPTIFADELLKEGIVDVIVRGEGENITLELVHAVQKKSSFRDVEGISFREDNSIFHNPTRTHIEDLDKLPYPAWHLFDLQYYKEVPLAFINKSLALPILGSRGCPYKCMFCAQDKIYPKPRYRRCEEIIKELEYMHSRFNARYFGFIDAVFPFSIDFGKKFCNELTRSGLHKKIRWVTETRVDLVNEELLLMMKNAGVHLIMFGFEVGSQKVLDTIDKYTTLDQAREVMRLTKKLNIYTLGLFMMGLPGETKNTCEETIKFAKEISPDIAKFNIAIPYPGSKFFEDYCKNKDYLSKPEIFNGWYDWADRGRELVYVPEKMSAKELLGLQRRAMFEFYSRPKVVVNYLIHQKSSFRKLAYGAYVLISKYLLYLIDSLFDKIKFS